MLKKESKNSKNKRKPLKRKGVKGRKPQNKNAKKESKNFRKKRKPLKRKSVKIKKPQNKNANKQESLNFQIKKLQHQKYQSQEPTKEKGLKIKL